MGPIIVELSIDKFDTRALMHFDLPGRGKGRDLWHLLFSESDGK